MAVIPIERVQIWACLFLDCWYYAGVRLQIWVCLICVIFALSSPTQTGLCKFGWVWSSPIDPPPKTCGFRDGDSFLGRVGYESNAPKGTCDPKKSIWIEKFTPGVNLSSPIEHVELDRKFIFAGSSCCTENSSAGT